LIVEKTQIQALVLTLFIIGGLGYFFVPDSVFERIEIREWIPKIPSADKANKTSTKSKKRNRKKRSNPDANKIIDSHLGIPVYHNGTLSAVYGRHVTEDGYNLGLKYQCVEFVKRFYHDYYNHRMRQSYGHAKEFFDWNVEDGGFNYERGLNQYRNGGFFQPRENAILIFGPDRTNSFGHVGIISSVRDGEIEMISQNNGRSQKSRSTIPLLFLNGRWKIDSEHVIGWLSR